MREKGNQGLDIGLCLSLGFQEEEWLAATRRTCTAGCQARNEEESPEGGGGCRCEM